MLIYFIIILAVVARFVPHMPNFAPITALAIFSAANLGWKKSFAITFGARLISDIFLGFFAWPLMVAVYAAHLVGILLGLWIKKTTSPVLSTSSGTPSPYKGRGGERLQYRWLKIIASSLGSSVVFFLITNFAFFYSGYAHTLSGIMLSYANGLPFFRGTLLGDLSYSVALFGAYELVKYFTAGNKSQLSFNA